MFGWSKAAPDGSTGEIWSLEGDLYIAISKGPGGQALARRQLPCLKQARDWLEEQGIERIEMRLSSAYSEMCGED
ncbi:hypothetical protein [Ferrimonas balearica]|uniref:hypothetical protein n=1 Tax=Ferrimonas balearica TaxID=44012 RepID=UPI001C98E7E0|nr:hypothetical protein [Ferrimonas balearica]MBY5991193.1 hypothetical protein [Ferrimonas balearica]